VAVLKLQTALLLVGGVLLAYYLGTCSGKSAASASTKIDQAHVLLDAGKAYRRRLAEIDRVAKAARDSAADYRRRFQIRGALIAKLDTALSRATTRADSFPIVLQQNITLRGQLADLVADTLRLSRLILTAQASGDLARQRVDSLEARLRGVLTVAECRWNLVVAHPKCPSRTAVGLMGLGTGVVATLVLRP